MQLLKNEKDGQNFKGTASAGRAIICAGRSNLIGENEFKKVWGVVKFNLATNQKRQNSPHTEINFRATHFGVLPSYF